MAKKKRSPRQPRAGAIFSALLLEANQHLGRPLTVEEVVEYARAHRAGMLSQALKRMPKDARAAREELRQCLGQDVPFDRERFPRAWFYIAGVYEMNRNVLVLRPLRADGRLAPSGDHFLHVRAGLVVPPGFCPLDGAGALIWYTPSTLRRFRRTGEVKRGMSKERARLLLACLGWENGKEEK